MLGSIVQSDGGHEADVAHRLRSAGAAWARLKPTCFSGSLIGPARKYSLFRVFVLTRLLYGVEAHRTVDRATVRTPQSDWPDLRFRIFSRAPRGPPRTPAGIMRGMRRIRPPVAFSTPFTI